MKKFIFLIVCLVFCNIAISGTMRHDVPEQKFLDFGQKFFCTKKIIGVKQKENIKTYAIGTCVILNNNWIITCAHISEEEVDYLTVIVDDKSYVLDQFIVNKDYDGEKMHSDIALGYRAKGFGEVNGAELYKEKIKLSDYCALAGFGQHGSMATGVSGYDGKLRAGTNRVHSFFRQDMILINGSRDNSRTELEFLPNVGDSGGGLFIKGKLAGITSLVLSGGKGNEKADSNYGDEGGFTQIYPHLEWINKYVKKK